MLTPFVLSGGSGVRLWPLSRAAFPKQFCELLDESLLVKTLKRVRAFGAPPFDSHPFSSPWTLTTQELAQLTKRAHREAGIDESHVIGEPMGRNTAPAIALICRFMQMHGRGAEIVGVFPADHLIGKEDEFARAIALAAACARDGLVATLGIRPDSPSTGFGYIEVDSARVVKRAEGSDLAACATKGFREKPDLQTAQEFLRQGRFFWNAGMFVFQADRMAAHFARLAPEIWARCEELRPDLSNLGEVYAKMPSISVDYAIMEKLAEQVCVPCDLGWSDLGSWDDIAELAGRGGAPLANRARAAAVDSNGSFVFSPTDKVFALVGVEDVILVDTPDALLAVRRGSAQRVREAVELASRARPGIEKQHPFERRPWGGFSVLRDEAHYKSKHIYVEPGAQISYQSHAKRAEHWIIVAGRGEVVLDDKTIPVETGSSVFIPLGAKHRIRCAGPENLEFVEVQTGTYFGEDDIVRYKDDYDRA